MIIIEYEKFYHVNCPKKSKKSLGPKRVIRIFKKGDIITGHQDTLSGFVCTFCKKKWEIKEVRP